MIRLSSPDGRINYQLLSGSNKVGRSSRECGIVLRSSRSISGTHAEIFVENDEYGEPQAFLRDLGSRNGTYLNQEHLSLSNGKKGTPLKDGDSIRFGYDDRSFILHFPNACLEEGSSLLDDDKIIFEEQVEDPIQTEESMAPLRSPASPTRENPITISPAKVSPRRAVRVKRVDDKHIAPPGENKQLEDYQKEMRQFMLQQESNLTSLNRKLDRVESSIPAPVRSVDLSEISQRLDTIETLCTSPTRQGLPSAPHSTNSSKPTHDKTVPGWSKDFGPFNMRDDDCFQRSGIWKENDVARLEPDDVVCCNKAESPSKPAQEPKQTFVPSKEEPLLEKVKDPKRGLGGNRDDAKLNLLRMLALQNVAWIVKYRIARNLSSRFASWKANTNNKNYDGILNKCKARIRHIRKAHIFRAWARIAWNSKLGRVTVPSRQPRAEPRKAVPPDTNAQTKGGHVYRSFAFSLGVILQKALLKRVKVCFGQWGRLTNQSRSVEALLFTRGKRQLVAKWRQWKLFIVRVKEKKKNAHRVCTMVNRRSRNTVLKTFLSWKTWKMATINRRQLIQRMKQRKSLHVNDKVFHGWKNWVQVCKEQRILVAKTHRKALANNSSNNTNEMNDLLEELRVTEQSNALKDLNSVFVRAQNRSVSRAISKWKAVVYAWKDCLNACKAVLSIARRVEIKYLGKAWTRLSRGQNRKYVEQTAQMQPCVFEATPQNITRIRGRYLYMVLTQFWKRQMKRAFGCFMGGGSTSLRSKIVKSTPRTMVSESTSPSSSSSNRETFSSSESSSQSSLSSRSDYKPEPQNTLQKEFKEENAPKVYHPQNSIQRARCFVRILHGLVQTRMRKSLYLLRLNNIHSEIVKGKQRQSLRRIVRLVHIGSLRMAFQRLLCNNTTQKRYIKQARSKYLGFVLRNFWKRKLIGAFVRLKGQSNTPNTMVQLARGRFLDSVLKRFWIGQVRRSFNRLRMVLRTKELPAFRMLASFQKALTRRLARAFSRLQFHNTSSHKVKLRGMALVINTFWARQQTRVFCALRENTLAQKVSDSRLKRMHFLLQKQVSCALKVALEKLASRKESMYKIQTDFDHVRKWHMFIVLRRIVHNRMKKALFRMRDNCYVKCQVPQALNERLSQARGHVLTNVFVGVCRNRVRKCFQKLASHRLAQLDKQSQGKRQVRKLKSIVARFEERHKRMAFSRLQSSNQQTINYLAITRMIRILNHSYSRAQICAFSLWKKYILVLRANDETFRANDAKLNSSQQARLKALKLINSMCISVSRVGTMQAFSKWAIHSKTARFHSLHKLGGFRGGLQILDSCVKANTNAKRHRAFAKWVRHYLYDEADCEVKYVTLHALNAIFRKMLFIRLSCCFTRWCRHTCTKRRMAAGKGRILQHFSHVLIRYRKQQKQLVFSKWAKQTQWDKNKLQAVQTIHRISTTAIRWYKFQAFSHWIRVHLQEKQKVTDKTLRKQSVNIRQLDDYFQKRNRFQETSKYWRIWIQATKGSSPMWRATQAANSLRRYNLGICRSCFQQWVSFRREQLVLKRLVGIVSKYRLRKSFLQLRTRSFRNSRLKFVLMHYSFRTIRTHVAGAFNQWKVVHSISMKTRASHFALMRLPYHRKRDLFANWKKCYLSSKHLQAQSTKADIFHLKKLFSKILHGWKMVVQKKTSISVKQKRTENRLRKLQTRRAFQYLRTNALRARQINFAKISLEKRTRLNAICAAWGVWRSSMRIPSRHLNIARNARWKTVKSCFSEWAALTSTARARRKAGEKLILARTFRQWEFMTEKYIFTSKLVDHFTKKLNTKRKRALFRVWKQSILFSNTDRIAQHALRRHERRILRRTWTNWNVLRRESHMRRVTALRYASMIERGFLRKMFLGFQNATLRERCENEKQLVPSPPSTLKTSSSRSIRPHPLQSTEPLQVEDRASFPVNNEMESGQTLQNVQGSTEQAAQNTRPATTTFNAAGDHKTLGYIDHGTNTVKTLSKSVQTSSVNLSHGTNTIDEMSFDDSVFSVDSSATDTSPGTNQSVESFVERNESCEYQSTDSLSPTITREVIPEYSKVIPDNTTLPALVKTDGKTVGPNPGPKPGNDAAKEATAPVQNSAIASVNISGSKEHASSHESASQIQTSPKLRRSKSVPVVESSEHVKQTLPKKMQPIRKPGMEVAATSSRKRRSHTKNDKHSSRKLFLGYWRFLIMRIIQHAGESSKSRALKARGRVIKIHILIRKRSSQRKSRLLNSVFWEWRHTTSLKKVLWQATYHRINRSRYWRVLRKHFQGWKRLCDDLSMKRQLLSRERGNTSFRLLREFFSNWKMLHTSYRYKLRLAHHSTQQQHKKVVRLCFQGWKQVLDKISRKDQMRRCFDAWAGYTLPVRAASFNGVDQIVSLTLQIRQDRLKRSAFKAWNDLVCTETRKHKQLQAAITKRYGWLLKLNFQKWKKEARNLKLKRKAVHKFIRRKERWVLVTAFARLARANSKPLKTFKRVVLRRKHTMLRRALTRWRVQSKASDILEKQKRKFGRYGLKRFSKTRRASVFAAWRLYARKAAGTRAKYTNLLRWRSKKSVDVCFDAWVQITFRTKERRLLLERQKQKRKHQSLEKTFSRWKEYQVAEALRKQNEALEIRKLKEVPFSQWMRWVKNRADIKKRLLNQRNQRLVQTLYDIWADIRPCKEEACTRIFNTAKQNVRQRLAAGWRRWNGFVVGSREHANAKLAVATHVSELLKKCQMMENQIRTLVEQNQECRDSVDSFGSDAGGDEAFYTGSDYGGDEAMPEDESEKDSSVGNETRSPESKPKGDTVFATAGEGDEAMPQSENDALDVVDDNTQPKKEKKRKKPKTFSENPSSKLVSKLLESDLGKTVEGQETIIAALRREIGRLTMIDCEKSDILAKVVLNMNDEHGDDKTSRSKELVLEHLQEIDQAKIELQLVRDESEKQQKFAAKELLRIRNERDRIEKELLDAQRTAAREREELEIQLALSESNLEKINKWIAGKAFTLKASSREELEKKQGQALSMLQAQVGAARKREAKARMKLKEIQGEFAAIMNKTNVSHLQQQQDEKEALIETIRTLKAQVQDLQARGGVNVLVEKEKVISLLARECGTAPENASSSGKRDIGQMFGIKKNGNSSSESRDIGQMFG
eukprot:CAMPEP_0203747144 /NCGR_PEP_ID=MMETSP0098-20131031/2374_1 /ASSEMBLY_ACC=CAM_ASM_000208 /TAXON_ID=96639 /ORGANISM=" , Strain NY0313808BC1" /LENGTH=3118 /DNA_ID=CAMNT_0050635483 /DNA_START=2236 /DNA_END=11589 /DNA_ORIENTATION=+